MPQPLASWRDTPAREAIVSFAESAVERLPQEERVAVFDNDGTLWCEKPIPIQLDFLLHRMAQQAVDDPSLADRQPYKAASERDLGWLGQAMVRHYQGDDTDIGLLMAASGAAFGGTTVEAFSGEVREWFATSEHPTLRFASVAGRDALRLVVRHDDAEREFDDTSGAEGVLQRADERGWTVVSMRDDWATVFSDG
jgi:hypothetical protein